MTTIERTTTATQRAIIAMLQENTGSHFLDSGMAYGYAYQKRAGIDYARVPYATATAEYGYVKSLYHHLSENLHVDADENAKFKTYASDESRRYDSWGEILESYCEENGYTGVYSDNSYNHENVLDGTFQWYEIDTDDDRQLVVIQTHNGCDVRGGYSTPTWFEYSSGYRDDSGLTLFGDGYLYCTQNSDHRFNTDDAYHWYSDTETGTYELENDGTNILCPHCGGALTA